MSPTADSETTPAIERRTFLRRAGLGAATAGAVWAAPSITGFDAAFAGASCAREETLDWSSFANGFAFTSQNYPAVPGYPAVTLTVTTTLVGTPNPTGTNATVQPGTFGSLPGKYYLLQGTPANTTSGFNTTIAFTVPVFNVRFTLLDIDRQNGGGGLGWQDRLWFDPTPAGITTVKNDATRVFGTGTSANPWTGLQNTNVANGSPNGNVAVTIPTTSGVALRYRAGDLLTVAQRIGIANITFCR